MIEALRNMEWLHRLSFLLRASRARVRRELGLLPPPLWGRGGERGGNRLSICGHPSPCPSPTRGEGTMWHWCCATLSVTVACGLGHVAFAQTPPPAPQPRVTIGYVDIAGDPRHEPIKAYERIVLKQRESPFAAAQVGLDEAQALSRVLKIDFALE